MLIRRDGETIEEAKTRLKQEEKERQEKKEQEMKELKEKQEKMINGGK